MTFVVCSNSPKYREQALVVQTIKRIGNCDNSQMTTRSRTPDLTYSSVR